MAPVFEPGDIRFVFEHDGNLRQGIETRDGNRVPQISNRESRFYEFAGNIFSTQLKLKGLPLSLKVINESTGEVITETKQIEKANEVTLKIPLRRKHVGDHRFLVAAENNFGKVLYGFELLVLDQVKEDDNSICTVI